MKRCPNCKAEILFDSTEFCEHCGVSLKTAAKPIDDDSLEFTVSEAHDSKEDDSSTYSARPAKDGLGVQSSAEWLQGQADAAEPVTPPPDDSQTTGKVNAPSSEADITESQKIRCLSQEEVQSIEKKLYSKGSYLSEVEKAALLKKMASGSSEKPAEITAASPGELPKLAMSKRGRGIAYFMKNYIQVHGDADLHENDEIFINERPYLLRKKRLTTKTMAIAASVGFLVLMAILVPMLVRDAHSGEGEIVGVVLDENHQPFIGGATIRLPESGTTVNSNSQGFFRIFHLDPGTYRVEYLVNGQTIKVDYATVTAGDLTTLTLYPGAAETTAEMEPVVSEPSPDYNQAYDDNRPTPSQAAKVAQKKPEGSTNQSGFGKLALSANVEGAKLTVDGVVLGAGNLTYTGVKSGERRYTVSKDGFQLASGVVTITPSQTANLDVVLSPTAENQIVISLQGRYDQAMGWLRAGESDRAIASLGEILDENPGFTQGYLGRGEAFQSAGQKVAAHDDYLRAAEIFRINKDYGNAMTAFNSAAKMDPKSVPALLGRASLHMARQEEIAAIADYEAILNVDRRNAQAHFGLGEARFSQGNYKQAIKHFKDARSEDPGNPLVHQYLMLCYFGDDDLKNVKKSYDKFKEMATAEQVQRMRGDKTYTAVLRIVENQL